MPNHVINEVTLHDVPLSKAAPITLNDDGRIDFSVLLPLPLNFWPGSVGTKHEKAFPGTHLDAAREVWGTKWNAYGIDEGGRYASVREADGSTVLTFQTAWSHPRGWVVAVFNKLQCDITAKWLDEGRSDGVLETYNYAALADLLGEAWAESPIPNGSAEHRRLHQLYWGVDRFDDD